MITWGISANSHDAALAVFVDNELVFASHSERFSGIKNDKHLCDELVDYARNNWGNPSRVYWYENPYLKTVRQLFAGQGWKWKENNIRKYLAKWSIHAPISYTSHHMSHAAAGYFTSPYSDACVVVIDAIGEYNTLTIWQGKGNRLTRLFALDFPDSVGLWYSAMTQRCHLKPLEDEYILMGMAAYGNPDRLFNDILNDFFWLDTPFTDYNTMGRILASRKNLHRGCMDWRPDLIVNDTFDIAAATQAVYEFVLEHILKNARQLCNSKNLVLMGGCALNCSANRLLGRYYDNLWIMPNPGDAGSSIGSVLAHTKKRLMFSTAYLGYDMGKNEKDENIVEYILEHKICGLARGKAEFGPRALGNRSLIADPRGSDIKDKVNDIKQRQQFRPFAPAILEEHVHDYFDMPVGWDNSRYMQTVATCRKPDLFPAVVHADNTSRVQTVANDGSEFRKLLELWYATTGCPMLLNTSLNIKGQPMVNDREDAEDFEHRYNIKVFT